MNENDRGDYYEANRDDHEEWGDAVPTKPRRKLASMISVRLSPEETQEIRRAAEESGLSVSAFLRDAAVRQARFINNVAPSGPSSLTSTVDLYVITGPHHLTDNTFQVISGPQDPSSSTLPTAA